MIQNVAELSAAVDGVPNAIDNPASRSRCLRLLAEAFCRLDRPEIRRILLPCASVACWYSLSEARRETEFRRNPDARKAYKAFIKKGHREGYFAERDLVPMLAAYKHRKGCESIQTSSDEQDIDLLFCVLLGQPETRMFVFPVLDAHSLVAYPNCSPWLSYFLRYGAQVYQEWEVLQRIVYDSASSIVTVDALPYLREEVADHVCQMLGLKVLPDQGQTCVALLSQRYAALFVEDERYSKDDMNPLLASTLTYLSFDDYLLRQSATLSRPTVDGMNNSLKAVFSLRHVTERNVWVENALCGLASPNVTLVDCCMRCESVAMISQLLDQFVASPADRTHVLFVSASRRVLRQFSHAFPTATLNEVAGKSLDHVTVLVILSADVDQDSETTEASIVISSMMNLRKLILEGDSTLLAVGNCLFDRFVRLGAFEVRCGRSCGFGGSTLSLARSLIGGAEQGKHSTIQLVTPSTANTGLATNLQMVVDANAVEYSVAFAEYLLLLGYPSDQFQIIAFDEETLAQVADVMRSRALRIDQQNLVSLHTAGHQRAIAIYAITDAIVRRLPRKDLLLALTCAREGHYFICQNPVAVLSESGVLEAFGKLKIALGEVFPTNRSMEDEGRVYTVESFAHLQAIVEQLRQGKS